MENKTIRRSIGFISPVALVVWLFFFQSAATSLPPPAITARSMNGVWRLKEDGGSESLAPYLVAAGAPRFVSGLLARYLDGDALHFYHNKTEVNLQYKRHNIGIPVELPSNFRFRVGEIVSIPTPNGAQNCQVIGIEEDMMCKMIRYGPRKGEKVEDYFQMDDDGKTMIYRITHTSTGGKVTEVCRVFSKVRAE